MPSSPTAKTLAEPEYDTLIMKRHRSQVGSTRGGRPGPAAYGLSPPLFQPLTAYTARGRIFPAPARGEPRPRKPICKRDAMRPAETEKMETTTS